MSYQNRAFMVVFQAKGETPEFVKIYAFMGAFLGWH